MYRKVKNVFCSQYRITFTEYGLANYLITANTITSSNPRFDTNNEFDSTTNYSMTVAQTGYYLVEAQYIAQGSSATNQYGIAIIVNGSMLAENSYNHIGSSSFISRSISKLLSLSARDTAKIQYNDGGTAMTIDGWSGKTYLTIHRVR